MGFFCTNRHQVEQGRALRQQGVYLKLISNALFAVAVSKDRPGETDHVEEGTKEKAKPGQGAMETDHCQVHTFLLNTYPLWLACGFFHVFQSFLAVAC